MCHVPSLLEIGRRFMYTTIKLNCVQEKVANKHNALYSTAEVPKTLEVKLREVRRFMVDSLKAVGAPTAAAAAQADLMLRADCIGHNSHGLNRLELYVHDCVTGSCTPTAVPTLLAETASTAWVDGNHALGATIGNFCMKQAIRKARNTGVGWVAAKRCCHFGVGSYWVQLAEAEGFIGFAFSNTSPIMVPTRARDTALGSNPISFAAPACGTDSIVVDMATTAAAVGKIRLHHRKKLPIPSGWALDRNGKPTTDAAEAMKSYRMMPLGGDENSNGFKGYALAVMVEILTYGLSGSTPSYENEMWSLEIKGGPRDVGQCFGVINPCCFAPGFYDRVSDCTNTWRNLRPANPEKPVLVPGDLERSRLQTNLNKDSISYTKRELADYAKLAKKLKVKPLQVVGCS